jgi:hypothetical protein
MQSITPTMNPNASPPTVGDHPNLRAINQGSNTEAKVTTSFQAAISDKKNNNGDGFTRFPTK